MVDADKFLAYQLALTTNANLTASEVEKLLKSIEGLSSIEQVEYLMANYPKLVQAYGVAASDVARQFYQEARNEYFGEEDRQESFVAKQAMTIPEAWAIEDIQKTARRSYKGLPGRAVRHVMERADNTIRINISRDPKKARWAVVPHPGACGWCILIAGNGWRYSYNSVDAQRHDNCKCSIVPDFDADNPSLDGYDPKVMQDAYAKCEETIHDSVDQLWNELPAEKKAKYLKKGGRGKDGFRRDLVVAEMNRRDREWLRTGKAPAIDYSEKPREKYGSFINAELPLSEIYRVWNITGNDPEKKDLFIHDTLSSSGFVISVHETVQNGGMTNIDADLNGHRCEFKSPNAMPNPRSRDELKFVKRNLQNARHKFRDEEISEMRVVLSNYHTGFYGEAEMRVFERLVREAKLQGFTEAIFLTKTGSILRAK